MGQISLVISSGAQGFQGQTTGQTMEYGRRGVEISQIGGLGPTEVDGNHHQRVVFGLMCSCMSKLDHKTDL